MKQVKRYSTTVRVFCGLLAILGGSALIWQVATAEVFNIHFKHIAMVFALFCFGFVAVKGESPLTPMENLGANNKR